MMTRYDPFHAARELRSEINRAFGAALLSDSGDSCHVVTSRWAPAVDMSEQADAFVISADVPGVAPEHIEVTMDKNVLTIKGERKVEDHSEGNNGYRRVERLHGSFYRRFSLPETADAQGICASGKHGVLEVRIPKKVAVQPKRIKVAV